MTWPSAGTLSNANLDQGTDKPHLARPDLNALLLMVQAILAEAPAGSALLTNQDEGAGNGLDADTVDGEHASAFANAAHNHAASNITSGEISVVRGGTGRAALQHHGVLTGGTGDTQPIVALNPGTSGQVLTANGTSAFPSFQNLPTFPTITVQSTDFMNTSFGISSTPAVYTVDTGFGTNAFQWGISGGNLVGSSYCLVGLANSTGRQTIQAGTTTTIPTVVGTPATGHVNFALTGSPHTFYFWARKNL